jgi:hypothetical protein
MAYLDQRSATAAGIDPDWLLSDGCVNMWLLTFYSVSDSNYVWSEVHFIPCYELYI